MTDAVTERSGIRKFYALLLTQTFSLIGTRMTDLAVGIWLFGQTGNATPLTLVSFFAIIPRFISTPFAGLFADRFSRRAVMILSDTGQAVGTLVLLASFLSGRFEVWHLYAITLFKACFDMFQGVAFQATITSLVPDKHRNRANAVQFVSSPIAAIIAPAITGAAYPLLGVAGIIAIDLITFLGAALVLLTMHLPNPAPNAAQEQNAIGEGQRSSFWSEIMAGFRFVWQHKPLLMIFVFTGSTNFFLAGANALQTPYILERTNNNAALLGTLLGAYSAGTLTGALLMAAWGGTKRRIHTMMPGIAILGAALTLLGTQSNPLSMALLLFIMAIFPPVNNVSIISTLQIKVPPALQGRVFAAISQISMTLIPLSYLVAGPLADRVFEPFARTPQWAAFAPIFGSGNGAGMGLLLTLAGIAIVIVSLAIYVTPLIQNMDSSLPNYEPTAAG
ncbi:MAG: MFS transporter [Anaerolineae bacterium]|nr:MFS transporter [Anaerolineae bacterium]